MANAQLYDLRLSGPRPSTTMRSPRLLFVDNEVLDFVLHRMVLAQTLLQSGVEVHVAVPDEPGIEVLARKGLCVHVIHLKRKSMNALDEVRCFASLLALYRKVKPDIVHHIRLKPVLYGGLAASLARTPAVVNMLTGLGHLFTSRSLKSACARGLVLSALRLSFLHPNCKVIFQNPDDQEDLLRTHLLKRGHAVLIKGSGVDLTRFRPTPEPPLPVKVLMACRMLWEKGPGDFVAAAELLKSRGVAAKFILVGEPDPGHPSAVPIDTLRQWHASGKVEWWGWKDDMSAVIAQSHIVCLPSGYGEGVPRILIEAAASARPIVTTDAPGCREIVKHGRNGLLIAVRDTEGLACALQTLIADPDLRTRMATQGRQIAVAEFSEEEVVARTLDVYATLRSRFLPVTPFIGAVS
jgi:glycosyltransferase involved in cell wall biosynthesis